MSKFDVIIIGAGAAGMMCAIEAGKRGRSVLLLEHNAKPGEKIRISGGGRCNFTNSGAGVANYLSGNAKFAISALSRYTQADFIALVDRHQITWHEKVLGQLFCDDSAQQIIAMLRAEMMQAGVKLRTSVEVSDIEQVEGGFQISFGEQIITCQSLVIASGAKSIPKMGASNFGYRIAEQFGLRITETRPGLVPLTFEPSVLAGMRELSGVSIEAVVSCGKASFREAMLFTHRGLSGPAILQISSFWREGETIRIDMAPDVDVLAKLQTARKQNGKQELISVLSGIFPRRLALMVIADTSGPIGNMSDKVLAEVANRSKAWQLKPTGSEGYRTAEVTLGGVDTRDLNAKSMEARNVPGLYFVGEVVDVTGWLGGYNFQWAWSSGWAAGQAA